MTKTVGNLWFLKTFQSWCKYRENVPFDHNNHKYL